MRGVGRASQADARANRQRVVAAASRLFREKGVSGVSLAELMESVGLTHGGFYKNFASKDALVDEATASGFADMMEHLSAVAQDHGHIDQARSALLDEYLSTEHRDSPGTGCPAAGFAGDFAREHTWTETYSAGVRDMAAWLGTGDAGLAGLATIVGGLLLARATAGSPLSEDILRAVRNGHGLVDLATTEAD